VIDRERIRSIERWTMILGAVLTIAAFSFVGREFGLAVSIGAGIMILNTFATRFVSDKLWQSMRPDATAGRGNAVRAVALFNMKMAGVLLAIYLVIHYLHVHAVGLVVGLSVYPLGAVMSTLLDPPRENVAPLEDQHG
jgi:ATP synthase I chain